MFSIKRYDHTKFTCALNQLVFCSSNCMQFLYTYILFTFLLLPFHSFAIIIDFYSLTPPPHRSIFTTMNIYNHTYYAHI